jgi:hypothetical protein
MVGEGKFTEIARPDGRLSDCEQQPLTR